MSVCDVMLEYKYCKIMLAEIWQKEVVIEVMLAD